MGTQPWQTSNGTFWHPTMAPSNGTRISPPKCARARWHPAMAPHHGTLQYHGTQQWHQVQSAKVCNHALAPSNGTPPWHSTMAPSNGTTSNPPKCATLLLEVRTPIAKAIWGKTFAISDSFLSVGQASVAIYAKKLEEGIGSSIPVSVQRDLQRKMRLGNPVTVSGCLPVYVPVNFHHGFPSLES